MLEPGRSSLGKLLAKARELERLDRKLTGLLESSLAARIQVTALHHHVLVLATPSAAIATRLRLESRNLLEALHAAGETRITEITVRIAPLSRVLSEPRRKRELPEIARRSLERFAADCGDDEIREIINRPGAKTTGE